MPSGFSDLMSEKLDRVNIVKLVEGSTRLFL